MFFNNLLKRLTKSSCDKNWIDHLRPIIKEFKNGGNDPLTPQEVERLSMGETGLGLYKENVPSSIPKAGVVVISNSFCTSIIP